MQSRRRSFGNGFRASNSSYRSFGRGGFGRGHSNSYASALAPPPPPPPPIPRKADVLYEAGRLAAEYLVSKGLLPAAVFSSKLPGRSSLEPKVPDREPPPPQEGRTSALARLGSPVSDTGNGRKRFHDDYDQVVSRRGRRKFTYTRGHGSELNRPASKNGPWNNERSRDFLDCVDRGGEFTPRHHRDSRSGFEDVGSSVSRLAIENVSHFKCEVPEESGAENCDAVDDTGSKASSSSTKKEVVPEADVELSRREDEAHFSNSETVEDEAKSDTSADANKEDGTDEVVGFSNLGGASGETLSKLDSINILRSCSFPKVPTRLRSALAHRSETPEPFQMAVRNKVRHASTGEACTVEVNEGSSIDQEAGTDGPSLSKEAPVFDTLDPQPTEDQMDLPYMKRLSSPIFEANREAIVEGKEINLEQDVALMEEAKLEAEKIPSGADEAGFSSIKDSLENPYFEGIPSDNQTMGIVEQVKANGASQCPKVEGPSPVNLGDVRQQFMPTSFKICDLNLMEAPELTEITNVPAADNLLASVSSKTENDEPIGFDPTVSNSKIDAYDQIQNEDKSVQVIDVVEVHSPIRMTYCDSLKPKCEMMYSGLDNFLSHADQADDLSAIQDGYSLAFSELLGSDIHGCSSVQGDPSNLQGGMGLHGEEGVPVDDDSIYVSLGEFPMGFMEVWDQPTQDFGKFF